jgi:hypothetical protein
MPYGLDARNPWYDVLIASFLRFWTALEIRGFETERGRVVGQGSTRRRKTNEKFHQENTLLASGDPTRYAGP